MAGAREALYGSAQSAGRGSREIRPRQDARVSLLRFAAHHQHRARTGAQHLDRGTAQRQLPHDAFAMRSKHDEPGGKFPRLRRNPYGCASAEKGAAHVGQAVPRCKFAGE